MAAATTLNRDRIENAIEALMALLDHIDGDPNLEDNGDYEPSLGGHPVHTKLGMYEDCERDECDYEPDHDNEPDFDGEGCQPEWGLVQVETRGAAQ